MMDLKDIKIGMKVVPISKSSGTSWEEWKYKNNYIHRHFIEKGYLIVSRVLDDKIYLDVEISNTGNYFSLSDLVPFTEGGFLKFTKSDIKSGYVVETKDGSYMAINICGVMQLFNYTETLGELDYYYEEDLSLVDDEYGDEILRVWKPNADGYRIDAYIDDPNKYCELVWENKPVIDVALMNVGFIDKDRLIKEMLEEIKEYDMDTYKEYIEMIKSMAQ